MSGALISELQALRPDLGWRRGLGAIAGVQLADGRRLQIWRDGDGYAGAVDRAPSVRSLELFELLDLLTRPPPPPPEPVVQRTGSGVVVGNPGGGGR